MVDWNRLSEDVARVGAGWLRTAGHPADYSPDALDRLDQLITDYAPGWGPLWDGALDRERLQRHKPLFQRLVALGCYIGEALRRLHGGKWFYPHADESGEALWARLEFPNGSWVDPVGALTMRLRHGWSVASFVRAAAAFAEGRDTGGEAKGSAA
jgi:hypothetical protein